MRDDDYLDPVERMERETYEQLVAELIGDYLERRDRCPLVAVEDLAARAAELGPVAESALRFAIRFYEANASDTPAA